MDFLVLAAGEGSRLKKAGLEVSKPMVLLNGVPLAERLMQAFLLAGASRILVIYNQHSPDFEAWLKQLQLPVPLVLVRQSTPSSLHSFAALLPHVQSEKFCMTTVDTVFEAEAFQQYIQAFARHKQIDGLMAVTSFVDDESPLWVRTNEGLEITGFEDEWSKGLRYVSGGIYCLRMSVKPIIDKAMSDGIYRMRNFQRLLLTEGLQLQAHPFEKIMDVDRPADRDAAEAWLQSAVNRAPKNKL